MDTTLDIPSDARVKAVILALRGHVNAAQAHGSADEIAAWRAHFFGGVEHALKTREFDDQRALPEPPARIGTWVVPLTAIIAIGLLMTGGAFSILCFSQQVGCDGGLCGLCVFPFLGGLVLAVPVAIGGAVLRFALSRTAQRMLEGGGQPRFPVEAETRVRAVHRLLAGASSEVVARECGVQPSSVRAWWAVAIDEGTRVLKLQP